MEKLDLKTPNFTNENIEKIAELFPSCITEKKSENGELERSIDFDALRQELSDSIVEGLQERFSLNWPGKREALVTANTPISKTLRPCREESMDFDNTKNIFIEGDNLDALKILQETYLRKIKMIYIDPPYNTGNDFIYNDSFTADKDEYDVDSGQRDEEGGRLVANPDSNGRYHSDWLSMIYPRLKLARNLLCDDGVIFISMDENEVHNLRKVCDEVFGENNFQTDISWQKRYTRSNNTVDFTTVVEHIIVYSRSSEFIVNLLPRSKEADDRYTNPDSDSRGVWKGASFLNPATPAKRPNLCYPITNPITKEVTTPTTNAWRRSEGEYFKLLENDLLYWGKGGKQPIPSIKMFLSEARGLTPINFWEHGYAGNTDQGTAELQELMGAKVFDNPKPSKLIYRCLEHGTDDSDIILDFFSGSGTTAHAVMQLNAEDRGTRQCISVQLPEVTDEKSEAFKAGYKTIAEISKERIRRAGKKIKEDNTGKEGIENLDTGFRVFKIDSTNMVDVHVSPDEASPDMFDAHVGNIKKDRSSEDLLFQVLLDWGVDLSLPIICEEIAGKEVFFVDGNALAACFDEEINEEFVTELATRKPLRVVFRDDGFGSGKDGDSVKINVEQVFKLKSPATDIKVI
ncbi:MAG: site-specific DNA-methyltransferase [Pseudomonadales bacterium]